MSRFLHNLYGCVTLCGTRASRALVSSLSVHVFCLSSRPSQPRASCLMTHGLLLFSTSLYIQSLSRLLAVLFSHMYISLRRRGLTLGESICILRLRLLRSLTLVRTHLVSPASPHNHPHHLLLPLLIPRCFSRYRKACSVVKALGPPICRMALTTTSAST